MNNNTPQKPLEPWLQALKKKVEEAPQKESLPFDLDAEWSKLEASLPQASTPASTHKGARLLRFKKWYGVAASIALLQQGAKILRYKGYGAAAAATLAIGVTGLTWVMLKKPTSPQANPTNAIAQNELVEPSHPSSPETFEEIPASPATPLSSPFVKEESIEPVAVATQPQSEPKTEPTQVETPQPEETPKNTFIGPEAPENKNSQQELLADAGPRTNSQMRAGLFISNISASGKYGESPSQTRGDLQLMSRTINQPLSSPGTAFAYESAVFAHKLPFNLGAKVSFDLGRHFALETGLVYTLLRSDLSNYRSTGRRAMQQIHYLGIPVGFNFAFYQVQDLRAYVGASARLDKAISSTLMGASLGETPWQISLQGKVGMAYDIIPHLGLFVETGMAYYFDDQSRLQTFYKQHPLTFAISAGIQLNY